MEPERFAACLELEAALAQLRSVEPPTVVLQVGGATVQLWPLPTDPPKKSSVESLASAGKVK